MRALSDLFKKIDIVLGGGVGFFYGSYVFAEEIEANVVALFDEVFGGCDGCIEGFAGDKSVDDGAEQFRIFDKLFNRWQAGRFEDEISEKHRRRRRGFYFAGRVFCVGWVRWT
jgi:hypothetical protein